MPAANASTTLPSLSASTSSSIVYFLSTTSTSPCNRSRASSTTLRRVTPSRISLSSSGAVMSCSAPSRVRHTTKKLLAPASVQYPSGPYSHRI